MAALGEPDRPRKENSPQEPREPQKLQETRTDLAQEGEYSDGCARPRMMERQELGSSFTVRAKLSALADSSYDSGLLQFPGERTELAWVEAASSLLGPIVLNNKTPSQADAQTGIDRQTDVDVSRTEYKLRA